MIGMGGFAAVVSSYGMPFRLSRLGGLGEGGTDFMAGHEKGNLVSRFGPNALMYRDSWGEDEVARRRWRSCRQWRMWYYRCPISVDCYRQGYSRSLSRKPRRV